MKPLEFIIALNKGSDYIKTIFTKGGCYKFHLILKEMHPDCQPYINTKRDHIITEYKGRFYDVLGEASGEGFGILKHEDLILVESWSFEKIWFLNMGECPQCEEPLLAIT